MLLVAGLGNAVIGCIISWVIGDEVQILDLVVDPNHRRQGYALQLTQELLVKGMSGGAQQAVLEVHRDNVGAISLYQHAGFKQIHMRKGYYKDGGDALLMSMQLFGTH